MMRERFGIFVLFALTAGCSRTSQVSARADASTATEPVDAMAAPSATADVPPTPHVPVTLVPTRFDRAKLTFDGLADVTPAVTRWDVGGIFEQHRPLGSSDESLHISVQARPNETLDTFEEQTSFVFSPRMSTTVCGLPAEMVRGTRAAKDIECVIVADGPNHPAYFPPASIVVVAFSRPPLHTLFSIEVSASRPEDYAQDVDRILASIRCD